MASALRVQVSPSALINSNLKSSTPFPYTKANLAIVIVSNGPGELSTWVRPIAEKLHQELLNKTRLKEASVSIRLILVPCPNATGQEKQVAEQWGIFDLITKANDFWKVLINPKSFCSWPNEGLVLFLGGDQFWSVLLSARLGYINLTYAEWISRWPQWNHKIFAMSSKVINRVPKKYRNRCMVVGDLMADLNLPIGNRKILAKGSWVALLPGSKKAKLSVGVPFMLEVADRLKRKLPECNFLLPIAPTTNIEEICQLSNASNPIATQYESEIKEVVNPIEKLEMKKIITSNGTEIFLEEESPAYITLSQCNLAITTIGANTSELGALGVPMLVIVPTQHLHVMKAWDGFLGVLARLPILSAILSFLIGKWRLRKNNSLAWPNISAGRKIVPEKVGNIIPSEIANEAFEWLTSPQRLKGQKDDLRSLRGTPGAVKLLTNEIIKIVLTLYNKN